MESGYLQYNEQKEISLQRRPALLTFLCLMTLFVSGSSFVSYTSILFSKPSIIISTATLISKLNLPQGSEVFIIIILLLITIMTFFGALQMWHNKKQGFWIYFTSKVLFLIIVSTMLTMITTAFVTLLYWLNYQELD